MDGRIQQVFRNREKIDAIQSRKSPGSRSMKVGRLPN